MKAVIDGTKPEWTPLSTDAGEQWRAAPARIKELGRKLEQKVERNRISWVVAQRVPGFGE